MKQKYIFTHIIEESEMIEIQDSVNQYTDLRIPMQEIHQLFDKRKDLVLNYILKGCNNYLCDEIACELSKKLGFIQWPLTPILKIKEKNEAIIKEKAKKLGWL